jgi:CheY-like chemotaxis protein
MLDRVFELFAQADQSLERPTAGLGVGLTLARALVALHGGAVVARSEGSGKGSEFVVRLPLAARPIATVPESQRQPSGLRSAGHRVLVVDDNRDFASSLAMLLSELGNEVRVANDGAQGLEAAKAFVPQVAFLDIGMPKLNGYRLAEMMRAESALAHTHLVALTGWGQEKDRRAAQDAGFDRHLVKPVKLEQILDILETLPSREGSSAEPRPDAGASGS